MAKTSNKNNDRIRFISYSGSPSHMVKLEEYMMNITDAITRVTKENSRILTGTKCDGWHRYQRCDGKIHSVTFYIMDVIPGLRANIISLRRELKRFPSDVRG